MVQGDRSQAKAFLAAQAATIATAPPVPEISWAQQNWASHNERHERIAMGGPNSGTAILTSDQVQRVTNKWAFEDTVDYLPVYHPPNDTAVFGFFGQFRKKVATWPLFKDEPEPNKRFVEVLVRRQLSSPF